MMEAENYWVDGSQLSANHYHNESNYSTVDSHRNVNLNYESAKNNSLSKAMLTENMKSNLKTAKNKAVQFERYITLATWFLMVFSIISTFYGFLLVHWYLMPNLYFWDTHFYIAPLTVLGIGLYTLLVAIFGMTMTSYERRRWFVIYAKQTEVVVKDQIFVHGCIEVLTRWLENEVVDIIPIYAAVALGVALLEIITVALSSAYVAQITRRRHGDEIL